jgi:ABC-type antimicrobial peptide transport system permease subunit
MAQKLYGSIEVVNKTIEVNIGNHWVPLQIAAVIDDKREQSSLHFDALARIELAPAYVQNKQEWNFQDHDAYVSLSAAVSPASVEKKLRAFVTSHFNPSNEFMKSQGYQPDEQGDYYSIHLLPLTDLHYNEALSADTAVNKTYMYILLLIAGLILLIAGFNFVNLNTGLTLTRSRELGVRKCLGAEKKQVWNQIFGEGLIVVCFSMLCGLLLALLLHQQFNDLFQTKISLRYLLEPKVLFTLMLLLLLITLLSTSYPAQLAVKLKAVEVLKGKLSLKQSGFLRNLLTIVQFSIAIVLISSTLIIYRQFVHLREAPLGFNTHSLISIPVKESSQTRKLVGKLRTLLANETGVESITASSVNIGIGKDGSISQWNSGFGYKDKAIHTAYIGTDIDFVKTLGFALNAGRDFDALHQADSLQSVIVTESLAKQFGEANPIGIKFYMDSSRAPQQIVGVIPDFHLYSMYHANDPMLFSIDPTVQLGYILVRTGGTNPVSVLKKVQAAYQSLTPGEIFQGNFVDENTERWYDTEKRLSHLFTAASLVAILLSCMGLFSITFMVITQQTKSIGIRKVLGASVSGTVWRLTASFLKPVIVSVVIAIPVAMLLMNQWLSNFLYRIHIGWQVFVAAITLAVCIALLTIGLQVVKAATANPVNSLRSE